MMKPTERDREMARAVLDDVIADALTGPETRATQDGIIAAALARARAEEREAARVWLKWAMKDDSDVTGWSWSNQLIDGQSMLDWLDAREKEAEDAERDRT